MSKSNMSPRQAKSLGEPLDPDPKDLLDPHQYLVDPDSYIEPFPRKIERIKGTYKDDTLKLYLNARMKKCRSSSFLFCYYSLRQIYGKKGDDTLIGTVLQDHLNRGRGDDKLKGNGGSDYYYLSPGNDVIIGLDSTGGTKGDWIMWGDRSKGFSDKDQYYVSVIKKDVLIKHPKGTLRVKNVDVKDVFIKVPDRFIHQNFHFDNPIEGLTTLADDGSGFILKGINYQLQ